MEAQRTLKKEVDALEDALFPGLQGKETLFEMSTQPNYTS